MATEQGASHSARDMPRFSVIIPLHNRALFTTICARALAAVADHWDETEILFVDNGSTDGTAAFLATLGPPFRAITNAENEGFARACNRGAAAARGEYLVFLNNDTVPQPGWLGALGDGMTAAGAAIAGARLLFPDETIQHAGIGFNAQFEPVHLQYGTPDDDAAHVSRPVPAVTGACLMIARARFAVLGGFDNGYHNGFEDLDLCCRVREQGGRVWYAADSVLYHFESATAGRYTRDHANHDRFRTRWGSWLATDALAATTMAETHLPVRLARTYATGADVRRELDRVIADARAFEGEFQRLDRAYRALTDAFAQQERWARDLEADATRVRRRTLAQRMVGRVFRM